MMGQEIIVGGCVLAATIFLVRRWFPSRNKTANDCNSGCGGCSSGSSCSVESDKTRPR